jgi:hypothetical protein
MEIFVMAVLLKHFAQDLNEPGACHGVSVGTKKD